MKEEYIEWYKDDDLAVYFDNPPKACVRYITPYNTEEEKKSIKKYPFINRDTLKVKLEDYKKNKVYTFTVPKGYCWDGATIPRIFWRLIGSKTDNTFLIASLIHDVLCENHAYIDNDRNFSSKILKSLLIVGGVNKIKAQTMYLAVDNFQRFCGWK